MICDLLKENWTQIDAFAKDKMVVFLGIAPIEEHGRHLPIGVDVFETQRWIASAAELVDKKFPDIFIGILPVIPLGYANMGLFPGNIHVSRRLIYETIRQTVSAVAKWGVSNIIVVSAHADPFHSTAVEQACSDVNTVLGHPVAIAPMGSIFSAEEKGLPHKTAPEITAQEHRFPNDFHAGWLETSCMMEIAPETVQACYAERPDICLSGRDMVNPSKVAQAIANEGHIGAPRFANRALGSLLNADSALQLCEAACRFITRTDYEPYEKNPLYNIPGFQVNIQ
jgi:creatinine amidohydrolase